MNVRVPPQDKWGLDPLFWSYLHLSISQIYNLGSIPALEGAFILPKNGRPISKTQILGNIVTIKIESNAILYAIDDGTGIIQCNKYLNNNNNEDNTEDDHKIFKLGDCVKVFGNLSKYKSITEIKIINIYQIISPNDECLHWLTNIKLTKEVYSKPLLHDSLIIQSLNENNNPIPPCQCEDIGNFRKKIYYCRCIASTSTTNPGSSFSSSLTSCDDLSDFDFKFNFRFCLLDYFISLSFQNQQLVKNHLLRLPYSHLVEICLDSVLNSNQKTSIQPASLSQLSSSSISSSPISSSSSSSSSINLAKYNLSKMSLEIGKMTLERKESKLTIEYVIKRLLQRTLLKLTQDGILLHDMIDNDSYEFLDGENFLKPLLIRTLKSCQHSENDDDNNNDDSNNNDDMQVIDSLSRLSIFSVDTIRELASRRDGRIKEVSDIRIQLCLAQIHEVNSEEIEPNCEEIEPNSEVSDIHKKQKCDDDSVISMIRGAEEGDNMLDEVFSDVFGK